MKPGVVQQHLLLLMGHNQKLPALETAGIGIRAARQKNCYLLVLLMVMPEAW